MPRRPLFAIAFDKIDRAKAQMRHLDASLTLYERSKVDDVWSRTATIAFAVHSAYTGIEDVMSDIASLIDGSAPKGAASHQALLDQMHVALDGRRPALLDDSLYGRLVELKSFRHLVRHQYGVDLDPGKTDAKRILMNAALAAFETAVRRLEAALDAEI